MCIILGLRPKHSCSRMVFTEDLRPSQSLLSSYNIIADLVSSHRSVHRVHVLKVFRFFHAVHVISDSKPLAHERFVYYYGLQISHQVKGHTGVQSFVVKPEKQATGKP